MHSANQRLKFTEAMNNSFKKKIKINFYFSLSFKLGSDWALHHQIWRYKPVSLTSSHVISCSSKCLIFTLTNGSQSRLIPETTDVEVNVDLCCSVWKQHEKLGKPSWLLPRRPKWLFVLSDDNYMIAAAGWKISLNLNTLPGPWNTR